jgi:hypothetical protein
MPRDNRAGSSSRCSAAREPILSRCSLRGRNHRTIDPDAFKNPRPAGAEPTLTENVASPFHAEPRQLQELKKAYKQANRDAQVGFSQVYLYVFVVVDSREQNLGKTTYAGISTKLRALVDRAISLSQLHNRVGLIQIDLTQPMDYAPLLVGTFGSAKIFRPKQRVSYRLLSLRRFVSSHSASCCLTRSAPSSHVLRYFWLRIGSKSRS